MTFPREADMTARALAAAARFGCDEYEGVLEFEAPQGIPDLVFARLSERAIGTRATSPLPRPLLDRTPAAVVVALHARRATELADLAVRARLSESTVGAALRALRALGAVESHGSSWRLTTPIVSPLGSAVALELKLSAWKEALGQAVRHRSFADRSFVVMSSAHIGAAKKQAAAFRLHGVGLAALSPWGEVQMVTRPRKTKPLDPIARFLAGERLWAALTAGAERRQAA
jgi:hypothetical protein